MSVDDALILDEPGVTAEPVMADQTATIESTTAKGRLFRTVLLALAVASVALGVWAAGKPDARRATPAVPSPVVASAPAPPDPAIAILNIRPIAGTPYTVLFSGIGPDGAAEGPTLFTATKVVGVHNVVLLDTDTGASRRLLPDDARLVRDARLLSPVVRDAASDAKPPPPRWIALDVMETEGDPVDLVIARLDGSAPPLVLGGLERVVRVWSRDADTIAALVRVDGGLAYRLIDGETLTVTSSSVVPLSG